MKCPLKKTFIGFRVGEGSTLEIARFNVILLLLLLLLSLVLRHASCCVDAQNVADGCGQTLVPRKKNGACK